MDKTVLSLLRKYNALYRRRIIKLFTKVCKRERLPTTLDHFNFKKNSVDLAGENKLSPCDGICPNGKTYDVKSAKLIERNERSSYWVWATTNKYKEEIEIYYLLAFNKDWTKLEHVWRVDGEMIEEDYFSINMQCKHTDCRRDVESMKEYEIDLRHYLWNVCCD